MINYLLIGITVIFTVCGQILVKIGSQDLPDFPKDFNHFLPFILKAFKNIKILGGLIFAGLASISWMGALSRIDISFAYPFMGLSIVLVLALSPIIFKETVSWTKWLGVLIVCLGLWIASK